ncbi:hypothetical protein D3C78_774810 [compost metagenome]
MGDVGIERLKARIGLVDPLQGGVEGTGKLRHFRRQVRELQAAAQARWRQFLGFV